MSKEFKAYLESGRRALERLGRYGEVAKRVKGIVEGHWGDAKAYAFGLALEGKYTAASDIDILVVVDGVDKEEARRLKAEVYGAIDAPIELHVASSDEFERWYRRFVEKLEEIR
ncbi:MAG: nucleotidyltransferase domain-containing protein [Candidatus Bathyarchaeia archaeon]